MSPGLEGADRAINVLKAKAGIKGNRQIDIWGRGGDWKTFFHENHQRFDGKTGQWIEIPTSKIGSYMARLVPTRFEGGEE